MKLYIAVKTEFPDYMTPTLVAHAVLAAHKKFEHNADYNHWFTHSFKKCVLRVNSKEWEHVLNLPLVHLQQENKTLGGIAACAVVCPSLEVPNVLKFANLWRPV